MRWIPRLLAGTAVVIAAALTAAPVTAGLADLVLNPGPQTGKRNAQPALTAADAHEVIEGTIVDGSTTAGTTTTGTTAANDGQARAASANGGQVSTTSVGTELVAATKDDAQARITELKADLQSGVAAGEFTQADADRVVADIAGYIHGDRTWPERLPA